jgi:hypothetical protein
MEDNCACSVTAQAAKGRHERPRTRNEWTRPSEEIIEVITCFLKYTIDPHKLSEFETYAKMWLDLLPRFGGVPHGYFMPSEGASDIALAMFSFSSFAAYEKYRQDAAQDSDVAKAMAYYKETRCFIRYERSFFKPIFPANR